MIKTLTRIGNSRGVILDRTMLDHIGVSEMGAVEISIEAGKIVISAPQAKSSKRESFEEAVEWTIQNYDGALRRLADAS